MVVDSGDSRLALVPKTRNHPGFPKGISGQELLQRMREQAAQFGARLMRAEVTDLRKKDPHFVGYTSSGSVQARAVLVATGVVNRRPAMSDALHDKALANGQLRYCPICDGYEITDQKIAVLGTGEAAEREAIFLRGYTRKIDIVAVDGPHDFSTDQIGRLTQAGIELRDGPCLGFALANDGIQIMLKDGNRTFAALYPALGSDVRSQLAIGLGAQVSEEGCVTVDRHQRTSVPGLYAAGDIVVGLDQISHAVGNGCVAAAAIRNDLAKQQPVWR
jgi:thioredoxin reductase (NADPH)